MRTYQDSGVETAVVISKQKKEASENKPTQRGHVGFLQVDNEQIKFKIWPSQVTVQLQHETPQYKPLTKGKETWIWAIISPLY